MDEILDLQALSLLMREVIIVLWSTIVYNIFIDTDVATTGQGGSTMCTNFTKETDFTKERGNSTFLVN